MYVAVRQLGMLHGRTIGYGLIGPMGVAANVMYAGMRAQNSPDTTWKRKFAFLFGLPTSFITFLVVEEGSCKAFGIELPRNKHPHHVNRE